jgi:hypothetical protein
MTSSTLNNGPVFIVGAPRSGTTLLQYMLRAHPRISLPTGESHFFIPLYRNAERYGDLSRLENVRAVLDMMYRKSANFLDTDLHGMKFDAAILADELHREGRCTMPSIISGLFEKNARGEGKVRWGDKTPYYVLHMVKLKEWFPDAQFIHLIRDGRDVALSLFGRKHDFQVYNIYLAAKYWQIYVELGRAQGLQLKADSYMEMHYEDILADQEGAMRRICVFLREDFSPALLSYEKSSETGKTPLLMQPVQSGNKEKWRKEMTPAQIAVFESAVGSTLSECGYVLETDALPISLPLRAAYRLHNAVLSKWNNLFGPF